MEIQVIPRDTPHNGLCESLWRADLPCPNAAAIIIKNTTNEGYAIMCDVHAEGFLGDYSDKDVTCLPYTEAWVLERKQ